MFHKTFKTCGKIVEKRIERTFKPVMPVNIDRFRGILDKKQFDRIKIEFPRKEIDFELLEMMQKDKNIFCFRGLLLIRGQVALVEGQF